MLDDSPIPVLVGHYRTIRPLGKGCFGRVLLGEHILTGEQVAIKYIPDFYNQELRLRKTIHREICLLSVINHPHIVKTVEIIEEGVASGNFLAIVMENIEGGEIFSLINDKGPIEEWKARRWFRQILSAVEYCQRNFLVHRDLKPENILIDRRGDSAKLIDFGFANFFSPPNGTLSTYCGSPFYAAPELIRGVPYDGPAADMWSLGITLYTMLVGKLPFEAATMPALLEAQKKNKYPKDKLKSEAERLIRRMLEVEPKKRATLQEVFADSWILEGGPMPCNLFPVRKYPIGKPNNAAVDFLASLGYDRTSLVSVLKNEKKPHPLSTLYFLFMEKNASTRSTVTFLREPFSPPTSQSTAKIFTQPTHEVTVKHANWFKSCFSPREGTGDFELKWGLFGWRLKVGDVPLERLVLLIERTLTDFFLLERVLSHKRSPTEWECSKVREKCLESFDIWIRFGKDGKRKVVLEKRNGSWLWQRNYSKRFLSNIVNLHECL